MNIAKKTKASPNCTYGEPPVTAKKKIPTNAIAPITAHTAVTTLEVRLVNMSAPFVWWVTRQSYNESTTHPLRVTGTVSQCLLLILIHPSAWKVNSRNFAPLYGNWHHVCGRKG